MALERGSGKFLFLKQKGRTPPVQPIARSRALLTPHPKRAPGKSFLIKEYHKLRKNNKSQRDRCFAARMRLQGKIKGGVQYGGISGHKTEPRVVGEVRILSIQRLPLSGVLTMVYHSFRKRATRKLHFLVSLLQKGLKNFTLEKGDGLW